jgi:kynurenine formamidase
VTSPARSDIHDFRTVASQVRNWGRWGSADELGTLNFIDDRARQTSASLARKGAVFALGTNLDTRGPQAHRGIRSNPVHLMSVAGGFAADFAQTMADWDANPTAQDVARMFASSPFRYNDDYIVMPLQAASQWDALSHVYYDGLLYNGVPASAITSLGASKLGVESIGMKGVVGRGVLLDVARFRGTEFIGPGAPISPEELVKVAAREQVTFRRGDILLVRTGWWPTFAASRTVPLPSSGLSWRCAEWLFGIEAAAVATDNVAVESIADAEVDGMFLPLHCLCLRDMGLILGELWNLEDLSAHCASDGTYEFQLIAPPLLITGGVGSPVNPIALK